jgi:hypothetical protein
MKKLKPTLINERVGANSNTRPTLAVPIMSRAVVIHDCMKTLPLNPSHWVSRWRLVLITMVLKISKTWVS